MAGSVLGSRGMIGDGEAAGDGDGDGTPRALARRRRLLRRGRGWRRRWSGAASAAVSARRTPSAGQAKTQREYRTGSRV